MPQWTLCFYTIIFYFISIFVILNQYLKQKSLVSFHLFKLLKARSHRAYYAVDLAVCSLKIYFSVNKRPFYAA